MGTDVATGATRIKGRVEGDATHTLLLWVPDRGQGEPLVSGGVGGNEATIVAGNGGFRVEIPVTGVYDVRVNPSGAVQLTP